MIPSSLKPNTHGRRDSRQLRRVGVGSVYWALNTAPSQREILKIAPLEKVIGFERSS